MHVKELSQAASDLADSLATRPTSPGIEPAVRILSKLAGKVAAELDRLHLHPTDPAVAKALKQPLLEDTDAADKLAK